VKICKQAGTSVVCDDCHHSTPHEEARGCDVVCPANGGTCGTIKEEE
jgi:hypothetical protein